MTACSLCGLPAVRPLAARIRDVERAFCCAGCLNVYTILIESGIAREGTDLRDTELYRRSLALGLIAAPPEPPPPAVPAGAETRETVLHVSGMWCSSCAWLIERALLAERGVRAASAVFASDLVKIRYCPQYLPQARLIESIGALGYRAREYTGLGEPEDNNFERDLLLRAGVAAFLWLNVMMLSLVVYAGYWEAISPSARRFVPFVLMGLAAPAVFYSAWPVLRIGWLGLRAGALRADLLLALGILAAWSYSAAEAFRGGPHFYFDSACAIAALALAGKLMEHGARRATARSVALLHRTMPRKARLLDGSRERYVAVEAVAPGALLLVKAGERIPVDGVVESGASHVDESVLTGESAPVSKSAGSEVSGGSLNIESVLHLRATREGGQSALAQMVRSVEAALATRCGLERTVDRAARVFVPFVVAVAAATFGGWMLVGLPAGEALVRAIAVLVIACPCALGIATPLALTAAVGAASRKGILVNDMRVLETIRRVDAVVLDKTGTVTEGEFSLVEIAGDGLAAAAALETHSEHPAGRAIVRYAAERGIPVPNATAVRVWKGMGITGVVDGRETSAGSRRLFAKVDASVDEAARGWEKHGLTTAFFGSAGHATGAVAFGDRVRPEAAALVRELAKRNLPATIVSGDAAAPTEAVARSIGVADFRAEALPAEKAAAVRALQRQGRVVAMIGDGVNDAPALAEADLGIALGTGADIAMHAAPMVLTAGSLQRVPEAFDLARRAFTVVRQNLFWAFFYNTAGLALAAAGILTPILAAAAMALSSLSVIANSLRLRRTS